MKYRLLNIIISCLFVFIVIGANSSYTLFNISALLLFIIAFLLVFKAREHLFNIFSIFIYLISFMFLFLLYGPINNIRDFLITTSINTMRHQYIAKFFYNEVTIKNVLDKNFYIESNDDVDDSLVTLSGDIKYDETNEYEKQLFDNLKDNEKYRIIKFKHRKANAYLAAIYNPSKIEVALSKYALNSGEYVIDMARRLDALVAINGGRFIDPVGSSLGGNPEGVTIVNGEVITDYEYYNLAVVGFNKDGVMSLYKHKSAKEILDDGVINAVTSTPILILNGEKTYMEGNGGFGVTARTAIGQRKDGVILMLVIDTNEFRTGGASIVEVADILYNYGAINAIALDGGTSSVMIENNKMINTPINASLEHKTRPIPTAIIYKK